MIRFLSGILLVLLLSAYASASWYYIDTGGGLYVRTDGLHSVNDGWYYTRVPSYCNGCCCGYNYVQQVRIVGGAGGADSVTINYSKTWKEDLVNQLGKAKDTEQFIAAVQQSGLQVNPNSLPGAMGYGASPYAVPGYASSGYSVLQQGFAATGSTVYGNAAYSNGVPAVDLNDLLHHQARILERYGEIGSIANSNLSANLNVLVSGEVEKQRIRETSRGFIEGYVLSMQSANGPRRAESGWSNTPVQPTQPPTQGPSQGQPQAGQAVPPPPTPDSSTAVANPTALAGVIADVGINRVCAACHNAQQKKGDLDLTAWRNWDEAYKQRVYYGTPDKPGLLARLSTTADPKIAMPPPNRAKEIPDLIPEERAGLITALAPAPTAGAR